MIIGVFRKAGDGFAGRPQTLLFDADIRIVPAQPSDNDNAPDWRLLRGEDDNGAEVGARWDRIGKRASPFIAVQIDDLALVAPLPASLLRSAHRDDEYHFLWSRSARRERA
jgi:uncharacterized protein (DUF736 family)